jgi:hypothetical protein
MLTGQRLTRAASVRIIKSGTMQKFVLKLLLTSLVFRRKSKRVDGTQVVASVVILVLIASVGIYVWARGPY